MALGLGTIAQRQFVLWGAKGARICGVRQSREENFREGPQKPVWAPCGCLAEGWATFVHVEIKPDYQEAAAMSLRRENRY